MQIGLFLELRKYWQMSGRYFHHNFFDIQIAAKRSIIYILLIATVAFLFFGVEFVIEKFIYANDEMVDILAAVIGAFVFSKFQNFFATLTDRIFFRGQYSYTEAVERLNNVLNETIDLKELLRLIADFLTTTVRSEKIIFFFGDTERMVIFENPAGRHGKPAFKKGYRAIAKQCRALAPRPFIVDGTNDTRNGVDCATIRTIAKKSHVAAVVPFFSKEGAVATMLVGEKLSGEKLRADDKELLSAISHQAGMAIENARLYEALRQHSENLERRVEQKIERIKQMSDAQSKFLADIAHEFQTPIAILKGNIGELAKQKNQANSASERTNAAYVATTTLDRLSRLVTNLLDIAKLNFSKEKFQKRQIDMRKILEETRDDCIILAEDKNIALSVASDAVSICGDKDKLKEVLLNLISNALKHTSGGGTIAIEARRAGDSAKISVRDTGNGIAAENLPRVFDRFYKIGAGEGNGIGLHLCRQIIEAHSGTIVAESEPGKGSCFVIHLPLAPPLSLRQKLEDRDQTETQLERSPKTKNIRKTAIINQ